MKYKQMYEDLPIDESWTIEKDRERFINEIADIAFGEDAIERGYDLDEVIEKIQLNSKKNFVRRMIAYG